ncbi:MAG: transporter, family, putative transporter [Candidatus Parcubacteria bacterium]|jgi:YQGE family putative transporter|nr:transporter, family, putative transporter [Candidatus Parcubacteria bacterium]
MIGFRSEFSQFTTRLAPGVRRLFRSNTVQMLSGTLADVFVGAFIWQVTNSLISVAVFYLAQFVLQPLVFGLNGLLLRHVHIKRLFFLGSLLAGLAVLVVLLSAISNHLAMFVFLGFLRAVGHGLYWPNRNYLELQEVPDDSRNYYFGLIHSLSCVMSIIVPFVAGWFIVFGPYTGWYATIHAYWLIFVLSFLLMFAVGRIVLAGPYESPSPRLITRFSAGPFLNKRRALVFIMGMLNGLNFIVPVLVLMLLGNEGTLGTLTSIAALVTAVGMYAYGRFVGKGRRLQLALFSSAAFLGCAALLFALPSPLNVLIYVLLAKTASDFLFIGIEAASLAYSDAEMRGEGPARYSFIFDNELALNTGRVCSIVLIVLLAFLTSELFSVIYGPLIIGALQFILLVLALRMRDYTIPVT